MQPILQLARSGAGPSRLFGRLTAEMVLHALIRTRRTFPAAFDSGATYDRVTLFLTLLRYAPRATGLADAPPRALSISGISGSAGIAYETTRRHIALLCEHGLAQRDADGVRLAPAMEKDAKLASLIRELHDLTVAHIADLEELGVPLPQTQPDTPYRPAETIAAMLDSALSLYERARETQGATLSTIVIYAVHIANVRHFAHNRALTRRFARPNAIAPDELRTPIRISAVARALGLSYSTVAREVARLLDRGLIEKMDQGLIVPRHVLAAPAIGQINRATALRALQVVQRLQAAGFRFDSPESCYLQGRPPQIALH